jgi:hypothetical protein
MLSLSLAASFASSPAVVAGRAGGLGEAGAVAGELGGVEAPPEGRPAGQVLAHQAPSGSIISAMA